MIWWSMINIFTVILGWIWKFGHFDQCLRSCKSKTKVEEPLYSFNRIYSRLKIFKFSAFWAVWFGYNSKILKPNKKKYIWALLSVGRFTKVKFWTANKQFLMFKSCFLFVSKLFFRRSYKPLTFTKNKSEKQYLQKSYRE